MKINGMELAHSLNVRICDCGKCDQVYFELTDADGRRFAMASMSCEAVVELASDICDLAEAAEAGETLETTEVAGHA